ncbi:UNVERIFIED_CONTAM: hypothetical protein FKN15_013253 [Acipenser sinensis]
MTTPPVPTLTFGILESPSAPVLIPPLPQPELIEEEQDDVVSLAASTEEGKFKGGTEGSPSETYMAPSSLPSYAAAFQLGSHQGKACGCFGSLRQLGYTFPNS